MFFGWRYVVKLPIFHRGIEVQPSINTCTHDVKGACLVTGLPAYGNSWEKYKGLEDNHWILSAQSILDIKHSPDLPKPCSYKNKSCLLDGIPFNKTAIKDPL